MTREQAKAVIEKLVDRYKEQQKSYHAADYNETKTRRDFIDPFFKALGWDMDNEQDVAEPYREVIHEDKLKIQGKMKSPDYGFRLQGAKQRLYFVEAKKPSVALKTNKESAFQVRRYGWNSKVSVSILTNFEDFIVYDCSKKPNVTDSPVVGRLKTIHYLQFLQEFDFIYDTFSREAVVKGRFDNYVKSDTAKKGTQTLDKEFVSSLDNWRQYLAIDIAKSNAKINEDELNFAVQLIIDRLIFLRFCEDRGVETYGQLKAATSKGNAYENLHGVFQAADDKYNSGLFDFEKDKITQHLKVTNKVIKSIVEDLYPPNSEYDFKAMPVEVLGNAYEQFLGKVIRINKAHHAVIEEKPEVRKAGGVYYTPQYIVDYIVENTVGKLIEDKTPKEIEKIKIVDPACGSGSFLLGAFDYLLNYHIKYYHKNPPTAKSGIITPNGTLSTAEKKRILLNNIFGVDLDANAVEVSKLSLLLKCMEGETAASISTQITMHNERVLPDLDNNIKDGNSLIDTDFYDSQFDLGFEKKIKPFSWKKGFPEIIKNGGFDVVIGNPPYVQSREGQLGEAEKEYYYKTYKTAEYQINTFGLFLEKGINLLKSKHTLGFIIPNYWLSTQYDKKLRKFLFIQNSVSEVINVYKVFDAAVVDTLILIANNGSVKDKNSLVKSIDRNLKSIPERLNAIKENNWTYKEEISFANTSEDVEISFHKSISLNAAKTIKDYFDLKFGVKLYEVGKGVPPQTKADSKNEIYESKTKKDKSYRRLLKARHIKRYGINWTNDWVKYGDNLAAPRNPNLFAGERLLIQRIVSKEKLDCAITGDDYVCNTDVITLKPLFEFDCKFFLAILNSSLCGVYIKSKNVNLDRAAFPKINTNTMESFPVPDLNEVKKTTFNEIIKSVEILIQLTGEVKNEKLQNKIEQFKQRIEHTEEKIDQLVYQLYDLTPQEIKVVEESVNQ